MASKLATINTLVAPNTASDSQTPITVSANTAFYVPVTGRSIIVGIQPTSANATVTVTAGDGIAGVNDLTFSAASAKMTFIQLDTSAYEYIGPADADGDTHFIKITSDKAGTAVAVNPL